VIGEGTKIDNLVQIGIIARSAAIVSSCRKPGFRQRRRRDYVMLGGQVGIADHLSIGPAPGSARAAGHLGCSGRRAMGRVSGAAVPRMAEGGGDRRPSVRGGGRGRAGRDETGTTNERATVGAADIQKLLSALPHRYPFLMVDKIIEIRGDESAIGIKNVTANEPQFLGHFPAIRCFRASS